MNAPSPILRRGLLLVALIQGALADALLREGPWGLNLPLWAGAGIAGIAALACRDGLRLPKSAWAWLAAAWMCSALLVFRASEILAGLTLLAGVGCLVLGAWSARGGNPFAAAATDFPAQAILAVLHAFLGGFVWLVTAATRATDRRPAGASPPVLTASHALLAPPWPSSSPSPAPSPSSSPASRPCPAATPALSWARAFVGLLVAVPVLILFGALFASADPVFAKGLRSVIDLDHRTLAVHAVVFGFWAWICAGYGLRFLPPASRDWTLRLAPPAPAWAPGTEVLTGLGLLAALFLAFVAVQLRYLFGDDALVQATVGMTYAEYARRGFFELLAVALLLLPLLLGCDWLLATARDRRGFKVVAGILLALLGAVLLSAAKRLGLYTAAYGLTEPRLYAAAILVWLALVTLWFGLSVLPGYRPRFVGGAVVAALAVLLGLHALNPDAFIARHNLARAREGLKFDVHHFLHLGADATPVILRELSALPAADQAKFRETFERRFHGAPSDWRTWNFARSTARQAYGAQPGNPAPVPPPPREAKGSR